MESLDLRVLADALAWRRGGCPVTLVTVVQTWGSAQSPPGALLAVRGDGAVSGSVSGGCVEDDLIARIKSGERSGQSAMIAYGVSQDEAAHFGLPCGGTLRLVPEPLLDTARVEEVLRRTASHRLVTRTPTLASGQVEPGDAERGALSKPQAMLAGSTALARTLAALRASGLPWHLEDAGHSGMGDSIAAGVRAVAGSPAWLILPGDLPLIRASTPRRIATAPAELDMVVPLVQSQRGHPVRFSARCGSELMRLKGANGASTAVRARDAAEWLLDDIGCIVDIDTRQHLQQAEHLLARRNGVDDRVK